MNKNLKAALIIGGVALGLLAFAFVAKAAGLTSDVAGTPYRQQMMNSVGAGWQGHMIGANMGRGMLGSGMLGRGVDPGMPGRGVGPGMMGAQGGGMLDFADRPHRNWTGAEGEAPWENCPYLDEGE